MKESYLYAQFKQGVQDQGTHICRIESTTGSGISDINMCRNGVEVWVELKVFKSHWLHFRNSQKSWIVQRSNAGGRVLIVARDEDDVLLYVGRDVVLSPSKSVTDGSFAIHRSNLPTPLFSIHKPIRWKLLGDAIFLV